MYLLDQLLSLVAPHNCLGCSQEGSLLCSGCADSLPPAVERCYRCQQASLNSLTCAACLLTTPLRQACSVTTYSGTPKELVAVLKYKGAVAAAQPMARLMAELVLPDCLIVPVPTSNARRRQRGYDQAELLARRLSRRLGQPYIRLLARHGERHQIGAGRRQRRQQLEGVFRVKRPNEVKGRIIVLVDDVVTTGSTLEAAAQALHQSGAQEVKAVTFAQA